MQKNNFIVYAGKKRIRRDTMETVASDLVGESFRQV